MMHMPEDMLDSRLSPIDVKSSSSAATSPTSTSLASVVSNLVVLESYLRLDIRNSICGKSKFIERHLGFFEKPQETKLAL